MTIDVIKFQELDIRIGVVQKAEKVIFRKNPYLKLSIDFGSEIGVRTTVLKGIDGVYDDLANRQIVGVVNIAPKKITGVTSNVLLLGVDSADGSFSLLVPNRLSRIGNKVY